MRPISLLLFVLLAAAALSTHAQSMTDTLTWQVTGLTDLGTSESFSSYACIFKTTGTHDISWIQDEGSFTCTLQVTQTTGTWGDVTQNGSVTYAVTIGDKNGTARFERTQDGAFVTIDFSASGEYKHKYTVTGIQTH